VERLVVAQEKLVGAQERIASAAEEQNALLRAYLRRVDRQERYLDVLAGQNEFAVLAAAESAAAAKMQLETAWGAEKFKATWVPWKKGFDKVTKRLTPVAVLRRMLGPPENIEAIGRGEGTSKEKGKGKEKEVVLVEDETMDAEGEDEAEAEVAQETVDGVDGAAEADADDEEMEMIL
jgi:hypothetical protein